MVKIDCFQQKYWLIFWGGLIGASLIFSPGSLGIFILAAGTVLAVKYSFDDESKDFLIKIFIFGLLTRIILTAVIHLILAYYDINKELFGYKVASLFGDSGYYSLRGWWIAQFYSGKLSNPDFILKEVFHPSYASSSYLYIIGLFHFLFGFSPISVKFINGFIGALSAIFIYSLTLDIFDKRVAKISAILVMFFPSMFLWSMTNLKDTSFIFVSIIMLWAYVRWFKRGQFKYLILSIIFLFIQSTLRQKFAVALPLLILLFSYFITLRIALMKKAVISVLIVSIILLTFSIFGVEFNLNKEVHRGIAKLSTYQIGYILTEGSSYKILEEKYYPPTRADPAKMSYPSFAIVFARAWLHFIFEPFPWKGSTKLQLSAYPQVILWYFLIPFIIRGILIALRYKWRETFVLIAYLFIMTSLIALTSGNIGTVFRHRDMVSPFYLIFSAVGIVNFLNLWRRNPESKN